MNSGIRKLCRVWGPPVWGYRYMAGWAPKGTHSERTLLVVQVKRYERLRKSLKKIDRRVPPFEVTQDHRNRHGSIGYFDFL